MNAASGNSFLGTEEQPSYMPTSDEKTLAVLSHILTLVAGFVAPLVIWLVKKDESSYVAAHAKESLNYQITMAICFFAGFLLSFILIGFLVLAVLGIMNLVWIIMATIRASENKLYKYPFNFRFIK